MVGPTDLALSLGQTRLDAPPVMEGAHRALAAAREAGKDAVVVTGGFGEVPAFLDMGATMVVIGSDQSLLRLAAREAASEAARCFAERQGR